MAEGLPQGRLQEAELNVLQSLLGRTILSVDGMEGGVVESTYLRLDDAIVELAAVVSGVANDDGFPWRICPRAWSTETVFDYPLLSEIPDVGIVRSIDVFSDEGDADVALAFGLADDRTLWTSCAGGDYVAPQLGERPEGWLGTKVSRTL